MVNNKDKKIIIIIDYSLKNAKPAHNKRYMLTALFGRFGLRKTAVGCAFVRFFLRHIPAHHKPAVCFIRWAGTSYT